MSFFPPLDLADPITAFGLKMAVCMAVFLAAALGLRAFGRRRRAAAAAPASGAAPDLTSGPGGDAERRLHLQTIRLLIKELNRCDPGNEEASEAALLLAAAGRCPDDRRTGVSRHPRGRDDGRAFAA